jgi:hypothetical protein
MKEQRRFGTMRQASQAARPEPPAAWWTSGRDAQVFVANSGRRAHGVRVAGVAAAGVCAFWLAGLAVGMAGFSGFPTIGLRVLSHAAVARQLALRADAGVDRSAIALRQSAPAGSQGPVTDAEGSVRASSCPAPRAVLQASRLPAAQRRPPTQRLAPSSSTQALRVTGRPDCLNAVAGGLRRGPNSRLT